MDKSQSIPTRDGKNSPQQIKSKFVEPKLTPLGNLREITTQMPFSPMIQ